MAEENIIELASDFVMQLLSAKLPNGIFFHNVAHTQEVVKAAIEISRNCHFTPKQLEMITLAAWLHDTGYISTYVNHEDYSKNIANDFLKSHDYPQNDLKEVLACIEATRFPQNPKSPEQEVLADADLYHFTLPDYPQYEQRLRKEFKTFLGKIFNNREWAEINYQLLKHHSYYTAYGKNVLQKFKEVNVERLKITLIK